MEIFDVTPISTRKLKKLVREQLKSIQSEMEKTLCETEYNQLYVAQQTLCWAQNPQLVASPLNVILQKKAFHPFGTPAKSAGKRIHDDDKKPNPSPTPFGDFLKRLDDDEEMFAAMREENAKNNEQE